MKVLVTGGTGFIGAHSVKALLDNGHTVRMLVRSPDRIGPALGPLGTQAPEHVVGDVTDADSVRRALTGCDAVLHAASVYTFDARRAASMRRDNMASVRIVLGTAHERGLDPIVHVSSFAALLPAVRVPTVAAIGSGLGADAVQRVVPFRLPLNSAGLWLASHAVPGDDRATREELGVTFRPAAQAIADAIRWLYEAGHISARQAGRAAS